MDPHGSFVGVAAATADVLLPGGEHPIIPAKFGGLPMSLHPSLLPGIVARYLVHGLAFAVWMQSAKGVVSPMQGSSSSVSGLWCRIPHVDDSCTERTKIPSRNTNFLRHRRQQIIPIPLREQIRLHPLHPPVERHGRARRGRERLGDVARLRRQRDGSLPALEAALVGGRGHARHLVTRLRAGRVRGSGLKAQGFRPGSRCGNYVGQQISVRNRCDVSWTTLRYVDAAVSELGNVSHRHYVLNHDDDPPRGRVDIPKPASGVDGVKGQVSGCVVWCVQFRQFLCSALISPGGVPDRPPETCTLISMHALDESPQEGTARQNPRNLLDT